MQVTMTRGEIRTAMEALLGMASGSINSEMEPKHNAIIDEAYRMTLVEARWVETNRVAYASLPIDAVSLPYPTDAETGSVYSVAYWDEPRSVHVPIERSAVLAREDYEPLNAVGGAADEAVRDAPLRWSDEGGLIRFYPPADQVYEIRMAYTLTTSLTTDATVCPIDGEMVKLAAMMLKLIDMGDVEGAQIKRGLWERRIENLKRWQRSGRTIVLGEAITDNPAYLNIPIPRYQR